MYLTKIRISVCLFLLCALISGPLYAQDEQQEMPMEMTHEHMTLPSSPEVSGAMEVSAEIVSMEKHSMTSRGSSGTSWQPDSTPMQGRMFASGDWTGMAHGYGQLVYDLQSGRRGEEQLFIAGMIDLMAEHYYDQNVLTVKVMLSPDPFMGPAGYPLLLQTGETADGKKPLLDRQHPHELFSELALKYSQALPERTEVYIYTGLIGEPALGPPVYMHRFSGMYLPEAPITHHWFDSTHTSFGVITLGYGLEQVKFEASAFNGSEPDELRFNIDPVHLDSSSWRLSCNPAPNWAMQFSQGYLREPDLLHQRVDIRRSTFSLMYDRNQGGNNWQTTLGFGRNVDIPGRTLDAMFLESAYQINRTHTLTGRYEEVEKDGLFPETHPLFDAVYKVEKISSGYMYSFPGEDGWRPSIGGSFSVCVLPRELRAAYGDAPMGFLLFLRAEPY